jgi:hypothetical protein
MANGPASALIHARGEDRDAAQALSGGAAATGRLRGAGSTSHCARRDANASAENA